MTYNVPKFGAFALMISDCPAIASVCFTPGACPASCSICRMTFVVRSSDAESGNWTLTSKYPLSCDGMNPVGAASN